VPSDDGYDIEDLDKIIEGIQRNIDSLQAGIDREQRSIDHFKRVRQDLMNRQQAEVIIDARNDEAMTATREELAEDGVS
jgi:hypothetical protein